MDALPLTAYLGLGTLARQTEAPARVLGVALQSLGVRSPNGLDSVAITERLKAHFEALDGHTTWDSIKPLFDEVMHRDLKVVTADGILSKAEWEQAVKGVLAQGATSSDIEISRDQGDTVYYRLTVTMGNGTRMQPSSKGTIKDGQLFYIEPVDPQIYSNLARLASG